MTFSIYTKNGKEIEMCYMSADESMIEGREVMSERIYESYKVSNRK